MTRIARGLAACCFAVCCASTTRGAITHTDLYTLTFPGEFSVRGNYRAFGGQVFGVGWGAATSGSPHALLWKSDGAFVDLHPSGYLESWPTSVRDGQQGGFGYLTSARVSRALLWNGSNAAIDLTPAGYSAAEVHGVGGGYQVGFGSNPATGDFDHALLWHGTNVPVDLNPSGFVTSSAWGVNNGQQVGYGTPQGSSSGTGHALLWNGTNVAVDLNPTGYSISQAHAVDDGQQVGVGQRLPNGAIHALLWNGTNAATDLNPVGFDDTWAWDIDGGRQVGEGIGATTGNRWHALLWDDTAASFIDLHSLLPTSFVDSMAHGIVGNTIYGVGHDADGEAHAIVWNIPEPSVLGLFSLTALTLRRRRRIANPS